MSLDWHGAAVLDEVIKASRRAIDDTTRACVADVKAKRSGPAANLRTARARVTGHKITGRWGVLREEPHGRPHWELFIETGNAHYSGDHAKRRAADANYPRISELIRSHRG